MFTTEDIIDEITRAIDLNLHKSLKISSAYRWSGMLQPVPEYLRLQYSLKINQP